MYIFQFFRFNNNQQLNMEDMLWKFPHVGADVFKKLSNKNLAKCKKVARTWECFINNERFCKERVKTNKSAMVHSLYVCTTKETLLA